MIEVKRELLNNKQLKIANKTKHVEEGKLLYYDIVNSDTSKGKAIEILCDYLKIFLSYIIIISKI